MPKQTRTKQVGVIGVDAGLCWLGDPCYILFGKKNKDLGKNWQHFCDRFYERAREGAAQFRYEPGHPGLGVCVQSGHGDGEYPVFAEYDKDGTVTRVWVDFTGEETDD